jgi:hypothetical protein
MSTPALPLHLPAAELLAWLRRNDVSKEHAREAIALLVRRLLRRRAEVRAALAEAKERFPYEDFSDTEAELAEMDAKIARFRRPPESPAP